MSTDPQQSGEEAEILQRLDRIFRELLAEGEHQPLTQQPPAPVPEMPQPASEMLSEARGPEIPAVESADIPDKPPGYIHEGTWYPAEGTTTPTPEQPAAIPDIPKTEPPVQRPAVPHIPVEMPQTGAEMLAAARASAEAGTPPTPAQQPTGAPTEVEISTAAAKEIGDAVKEAVEPLIPTEQTAEPQRPGPSIPATPIIPTPTQPGQAGTPETPQPQRTGILARLAAMIGFGEREQQPEQTTAEASQTATTREEYREETTTLETILSEIVTGAVGEEASEAIAETVDQSARPLVAAAQAAMQQDPTQREEYQRKYDALVTGEQFGGKPLPRPMREAFRRGEIQSPEELYAREELGYRPQGDKPGRTFAELFTTEERETKTVQDEITRHRETFERLETGKVTEEDAPLTEAYEQGRVRTPADVAMFERRAQAGVTDVPTEDEIKRQPKPKPEDEAPGGGLADLVNWIPGMKGLGQAVQGPMFKAFPKLATMLFGAKGATAAGLGAAVAPGGALAGAASAGAAATPIGLALAAKGALIGGARKGVDVAVDAARPAMEPESADVISDMGKMAVTSAISPIGAAINMANMPRKIMDWAEALVTSRERLKDWNAEIAGYFARQEYRGIRRDIESGQRTAASTVDLGESWQDLLDEVQPIKDAVTVGLSEVTRFLVDGLGLLVEAVKSMKIMEALLDAQEQARKAQDAKGNITGAAFFQGILGDDDGARQVVRQSGESLHGRGTFMKPPRVPRRP